MYSRSVSLIVVWSCTVIVTLLGSAASFINGTEPALSRFIHGPEPATSVAVAVGDTVKFTCIANTTELPGGWRYMTYHYCLLGGRFSGSGRYDAWRDGPLRIYTYQPRTRLIKKNWYLETDVVSLSVQCQFDLIPPWVPQNMSTYEAFKAGSIRSVTGARNNATLIIYGPPKPPSNLTVSTQSSGALILSWSAPFSPVQLHYNVTVTNNITSVITVFNTSSTNITITRQSIEASSECNYYSFSVTASNPAGRSRPADLATQLVTFADVNVSSSSNGSALYIFAIDFSSVNISVELVNSCADEVCSVGTSIAVTANNHCGGKKVLVPGGNIRHFGKRTLMLPLKTMPVPVWIIVLAVIGALVLVAAVIITISGGFYLIWRWRKKTINSSVKC